MQLLKSKIQYMTENIQHSQSTRSSMQEGLTSLMDKYMVNDSIFGLNQYGIYEYTNGYFAVISEHESLNDVINVSFEDLPKSYVICSENGKRKVYISPVSSLIERLLYSVFGR